MRGQVQVKVVERRCGKWLLRCRDDGHGGGASASGARSARSARSAWVSHPPQMAWWLLVRRGGVVLIRRCSTTAAWMSLSQRWVVCGED